MSTAPIIITESAAAKVWELIQEEGNFDLKLRIHVEGGGCSGFKYGITFDKNQQPDDKIFTKTITLFGEDEKTETVTLLVDNISFFYLAGAQIDYSEDVQGEQFIIRNPNAKSTCGCGSSFDA